MNTKRCTPSSSRRPGSSRWLSGLTLATSAVLLSPMLAAGALAQAAPAGQNFPTPGGQFAAPSAQKIVLPPLPAATPITPNGTVVEDVIARVNDQIITRSEYERSRQQLVTEGRSQGVPAAETELRESDLLRDMIDQQLLLSKGKELGITGDAETTRRLDDLRKQNHLDSMEALEKAAAQQGISYEDFKQGIRNNVITQSVVRDEVGRRLAPTRAQEQAYYTAHQEDFAVPEQVHLSEILVPTPENATDAQVLAAQTKAEGLAAELKGGANFATVAKASSGGPTASVGGDLGDFKKGQLGQVLEDATFGLPVGGDTAPIRTRQGFVILKVDAHQAAGVPPLSAVEPQVQEAVYMNGLQPALRAYLSKARREAYVDIKPGFVDTGATRNENRPGFTAYAPPPPRKKTVKKQAAQKQKAEQAQVALAAARQKVAAKQAALVEAKSEQRAAAGKPEKKLKIHREKVRYGQAPRNALPTAPVDTAEVKPAAVPGESTAAAMSPTTSTTSISTGTGADAGNDTGDLLAAQAPAEKKTRLSSRERESEERHAEGKFAKAEQKASVRPVAATVEESSAEKQQAAPLGLNGDTTKKPKKLKRPKGESKDRLSDRQTAVAPEAAPAQTVNPALGAGAGELGTGTKSSQAPTSDRSTLPPADTGAPGAPIQGQPIPATTSATPGAPATVPGPH